MFNGGSGYNKIWWFDEYDKLNLAKPWAPIRSARSSA
jgi:hypothetical protein